MKSLYLLPIILMLMLGFLCWGMGQAGKHAQLSQMRRAYAICKQAPAERACANAQDATHTEYVCNATNCWLEVK